MTTFPHACIFCRKYYPFNDEKNVMKGGGECWKWGGVKEGDSAENSCSGFSPLDEAGLVQKQMYSLRAVPDEDGFAVFLTDMFLHVLLIRIECGSIEEGMLSVARAVSEWAEYCRKCALSISFGNAGALSIPFYSMPENENVGNPKSGMRKRMDTMIRGFQRNVQLTYRMLSHEHVQTSIQARIYNHGGEPSIEICGGRDGFMKAVDYCSCAGGSDAVRLIRDEFIGYADFLDSLEKELKKACS